MSSEILFVGYLTLDEWLRVVDRQRPVYALLFTEVGETSYDLRTDSMVIEVAQPEDGQALVHYANAAYRAGNGFNIDNKSGKILDPKGMKFWGREYDPKWKPKI